MSRWVSDFDTVSRGQKQRTNQNRVGTLNIVFEIRPLLWYIYLPV